MNTRTTLLIVTGGFALAALSSAFAGVTGAKLKQLDADGDGRITREEHAAVALAAFDRLDANRDGIISAEEHSNRPDQRMPGAKTEEKNQRDGAPFSPAGRINRADQNGDGQITRAEQEKDADLMFAALDHDKDGVVTESELEAAPDPIKAEKSAEPTEMPGRRS